MPDLRFTPPSKLRIADRANGLNASSIRSYNERLVLSLLLQHDGLSRLELCKHTGLSGQSVSTLLRSLEKEGLVQKSRAPREKGRLGPPTLPAALNPNGAHSVGISIDEDGYLLGVMNLVGEMTKTDLVPFVGSGENLVASLVASVTKLLEHALETPSDRFAGIGVTVPQPTTQLEAASSGELGIDHKLITALEGHFRTTVFVQNHVDVVATAESMYGAAKSLSNYLFLFLGPRLYGRLVLDHKVHTGSASGFVSEGLEGIGPASIKILSSTALKDLSGDAKSDLEDWLRSVAHRIEETAQFLQSFVHIDSIVFCSSAPEWLTGSLAKLIRGRDLGGSQLIVSNVPNPALLGAASLPITARFMVD